MSVSMDRPLQRSAYSRHRWWITVAGGLFIGILATVLARSFSVESVRLERDTITIGVVSRGVLHDSMILRASVVPRDVIVVDAADGGRVERVFVGPGDTLEAGQPIVTFSNTQLELQLLEQESWLIQSITQVQDYQASLEQTRLANEIALAEIDYNIQRLTRLFDRRQALVATGAVSHEALDQVRDELESYRRKRPLQASSNQKQSELRRKQQPQIEDQLETLQRDLHITRSKLDNLTVRAPYAGRVIAIDLKIGQTLRQGERILRLSLDTGFKLTQSVDEFYLPRLHVGQFGKIEVGQDHWAVKVARIYPEIRNGTFVVDFDFVQATPQGLLPGQTLQGRLPFGGDSEGVYIPTGPYLERSGGNWVFVVASKGDRAERRAITTGRRNLDQVEVLSGLVPGDRIITSDYAGLEDVERVILQ